MIFLDNRRRPGGCSAGVLARLAGDALGTAGSAVFYLVIIAGRH